MHSGPRWIIGFDASCGRCKQIAHAMHSAVGSKLEVMPLAHDDVQRWRGETVGADAPWVPTLIRVDETGARAWTGFAMGLRLLQRLGIRSALRLFRALGELSSATRDEERNTSIPERRYFFKIGAGAAIAAGIILTGKAPAFANDVGQIRAWILANKDRLPKTYSEISQYSVTYRKAIYAELSPQVRSQLWVDHVAYYRQAHPELTPNQERVIDKWGAQVADVSTFTQPPDVAADKLLQGEAVEAFGQEGAYALLAELGPVEPTPSNQPAIPVCECSVVSDWCLPIFVRDCYWDDHCYKTVDGCGSGYNYACNGGCL